MKGRRDTTAPAPGAMRRLIGWLVVLGGCGVLALGLATLAAGAQLRWFGETAVGTVVGRVSHPGRRRPLIEATVQFTTRDGQTVSVVPSVFLQDPAFAEGTSVPIRYLASNPRRADLDGVVTTWTGGALVTAGGVLILALGLAALEPPWLNADGL